MALTEQRRISFSGSYNGLPGLASVVRATKYKRGWVMVGHGTRMMGYPTGGFDNATASTGGGPLAVAGADADGGLRVIAKEPNVKLQVANGASAIVTVTNSTTFKLIFLTAPVATATAADAVQYLLGNADAAKLIAVTYTGTGAGLIAAAAATEVPFVRLLGVAAGEYDASDTTGSDPTVDIYEHLAQIYAGTIGLLPDSTTPPVAGQVAWIKDNATVTADWAPLLLPVYVDSISGGLAYCSLPNRDRV